MGIERRLSRLMFLPAETVQLRQICFTPGKVYQPGRYPANELPDVAFEMGLVDKLPPVRGSNSEPHEQPNEEATS